VEGSYSGWLGLLPLASLHPSGRAQSGVTSVNSSAASYYPLAMVKVVVVFLGFSYSIFLF